MSTRKRKRSRSSKHTSSNSSPLRFKKIAETVLKKKKVKHPSDFLTIWTPTQVKEYMFGTNLTGPIRDYIENVTADAQCKQAGIRFDRSSTTCWICGCVIKSEAKSCEHILPALRAVMLTGMITTKAIMQRTGFQEANQTLLESLTQGNYLWAHDDCNGSAGKSSLVLLEVENGKFVPNKSNCNILQARIRNLGRKDCYNLIYKAKGHKEKVPKSIYDRLYGEMEDQCKKINREVDKFREFDNQHFMDYYIEYTIEVIKLYANSTALDTLLTPEELEARKKEEEEKIKKLMKEQEELRKKTEKAYMTFLQNSLEYTKSGSDYTNINDVPLNLIIRLNAGNMLSLRNNNIFDPPEEITKISNEVTTKITPILTHFFTTYGNLKINFVYAIINLFSYCLIRDEAKKYNIVAYYNRRKINDISSKRNICYLIFILIFSIKNQFYPDQREDLYIGEYKQKTQFIKVLDFLRRININSNECEEIFTIEFDKRLKLIAAESQEQDAYSLNELKRQEEERALAEEDERSRMEEERSRAEAQTRAEEEAQTRAVEMLQTSPREQGNKNSLTGGVVGGGGNMVFGFFTPFRIKNTQFIQPNLLKTTSDEKRCNFPDVVVYTKKNNKIKNRMYHHTKKGRHRGKK